MTFDLHEWKRKKQVQETCLHERIRCEQGTMINGRFIMRFICVVCASTFPSLQMDTSDVDRKIASKKHAGKTVREIAEIDMPYVFWVAVQSNMGQSERYACARMCLNKPYTIPADGDIISPDMLYQEYVTYARDYIIFHGGTL